MRKAILALGMIVFLGGLLAWKGAAIPPLTKQVPSGTPEPTNQRVLATYGRLPLSFEANQGQTDEQVKFLSRGRGYSLFLTSTEAVLTLRKGTDLPPQHRTRAVLATEQPEEARAATAPTVLRMGLVGANPEPQVVGLDELPGKSNYFIGNDPKKWRTSIPHYAKVRYEQVYPGIDLVYYGSTQGQLEYDFVVAPGADPKAITLGFEGSDRLEVDAQGNLLLHFSDGEVRFHKPYVYQEADGTRQEIAGEYVLRGKTEVAFEVVSYDTSQPLIIDPVLSYSTFLGGGSTDQGFAIAVDAAGNAYVTGETFSTNFPTASPLQATIAGSADAFVTKVNPTGGALVYSTFLGGSDFDRGLGIVVDTAGNAYVAGRTDSVDFPATLGAFQTAFGGGDRDAFIAKLNPAGSGLLYATYLGTNIGGERAFGIAVDAAGSAYVTGDAPPDFPTTPGAFQTTYGGGINDTYVTKFNPTGSVLVYSTFLGGGSGDFGHSITVDASGNAYVTGVTRSTDFPTVAGAFQANLSGGSDAFVTVLNATGSGLVYSTFLGGLADDGLGVPGAIAVDSAGNAYVRGTTRSTDFPTTPGAFQTVFGGVTDVFVAKFDPTLSGAASLVYSTFLGGSGEEGQHVFAAGIAVDSAGNAYLTGITTSTDFPTASPLQGTIAGSADAFVTKLNADGSALVYSTYLGGSGFGHGLGIAVDAGGNAYVTGSTSSTDFPTVNPLQPANAGSDDAFIAKLCGATLEPTSLTFAKQIVSSSSAEQDITLTNLGAAPLTITSVVPSGDFDQGNTCAGPLAVGESCAIGVIFTPTVSGLGTGEVTITDDACGNPYTVPLSGTGVDFALSVSPASATVTAGQSASYTVALSPQGGSFDNAISLSCSNLPGLSSCSFSPSSLTPGGSDATSTLTVSTTAPASVGPGLRFNPPPRTPVEVLWLGVLGLALLGLTLARRAARRQLRFGLALGLLAWLLVVQVACGGDGETTPSPPPPSPGTPTGTFNITITGTAGSLQHSTTATLVVQ